MLDPGCGERRRAGPGCPGWVASGAAARARALRPAASASLHAACTQPYRWWARSAIASAPRGCAGAALPPSCRKQRKLDCAWPWTVRGHGPPEGREEQAVYGGRAGGEGGRGAGEERAGAGEGGGREGRCAPYCAQLLLAVLRGSRLHA